MRLLVLWSTPDDSGKHVIGELWREPGGAYAFAYVDELEQAQARGFIRLPAFPEHRRLAAPYLSTRLFPTFAQRVPSSRRPDFAAFLATWRLQRDAEPLVMLTASGGRQATDRVELVEKSQFNLPQCRI